MNPYSPHTEADVASMLAAIGADSLDELVEHVPAGLRARAQVDLPEGLDEPTLRRRLAAMGRQNIVVPPEAVFLGAGAYPHLSPAVVNHVMLRSEFATAYTPYQPEVSQGTLQVVFEFQTFASLLLGLDVANASMYDGASAAAEAVLMARRLQPGRKMILVSRGVHPHYREAIATYVQGLPDLVVREVGLDGEGRTDVSALQDASNANTLCLVVGYPNVLGVIEPLAALATLVHERGGITISATPEAMALAFVRSPGGAGVDIAVAEGQSFGLPMSFGGPGVGLFAARTEHVRAMPGRIVGETIDARGQRGFVLTLAAREQHIRRHRATSNICTNQGLCALGVTVYLSTLGREGLRRVAGENYRRAHLVADRLRANGVKRLTSAPFFNEFVVHAPGIAATWEATVARESLVPGFPLARWLPEYRDSLLVCVTEAHSQEHIERLIRVLTADADATRAKVG